METCMSRSREQPVLRWSILRSLDDEVEDNEDKNGEKDEDELRY